jgi:hypothetical protein
MAPQGKEPYAIIEYGKRTIQGKQICSHGGDYRGRHFWDITPYSLVEILLLLGCILLRFIITLFTSERQ